MSHHSSSQVTTPGYQDALHIHVEWQRQQYATLSNDTVDKDEDDDIVQKLP